MTPREKAQSAQCRIAEHDAKLMAGEPRYKALPPGRNGIVEGWYQVTLTAWTDGQQYVIPEQVGALLPDEYDPEDPHAHRCDDMGCGWEHVMARFFLPPLTPEPKGSP